jgi:hypothetical protein
MPNLGSLFTAGWIAGQGEKDLAEGVVKDPNIGWFSHLLRSFPLVRSFSRAAADTATHAQPVSLVEEVSADTGGTYGERWTQAWNANWDRVAEELQRPVVEDPRPLDEVLGQSSPPSDE